MFLMKKRGCLKNVKIEKKNECIIPSKNKKKNCKIPC